MDAESQQASEGMPTLQEKRLERNEAEMSFCGEMFGYDESDNDMMGSNRDEQYNCVVCGVSCFLHTEEMNSRCTAELFSKEPENKSTKVD